jgi:adenosylcobyric acid synthase
VVRLPRISNFTDVDALALEPGLEVSFASSPRGISDADLVVLPGTRATIADLAWLRARGLDQAITAHARRGGALLGICGGCQMLGRQIADPEGAEGRAGTVVDGLGLLGIRTEFAPGKTLALPTGTAFGARVSGYEIHHGRITVTGSGGEFPGGARQGSVFATMWHGTLEGDEFRRAFLARALGEGEWTSSGVSFRAAREHRLDVLADLVERHLDVDALIALARDGAPPGLPVLPPAGAPASTAPASTAPASTAATSAQPGAPGAAAPSTAATTNAQPGASCAATAGTPITPSAPATLIGSAALGAWSAPGTPGQSMGARPGSLGVEGITSETATEGAP